MSVYVCLWDIHCVQSYVVHHQPVLCTKVHKRYLLFLEVGVTPNIFFFIFWWNTGTEYSHLVVHYIQIKVPNVVLYQCTLLWCTV